MDIGAVLADDKTFYFIFCRQWRWPFGQKLQCNVASKSKTQDSFEIKTQRTVPQADIPFYCCCRPKKVPRMCKVTDESIGHRGFEQNISHV